MGISRGFSAEDLNGVRLPGSANVLADIGVKTRSGIVSDLEFGLNIDQKRFRFVLRSDSTEPRNSSRLFRSMRLIVLRKFFLTSPLGGSKEIISAFVLYKFFFLTSMAPDI